jgi:hypothetical protein
MTGGTPAQSSRRSLADYAWRVLGPREFVINVLINLPIAYWVYRHVERVPLVGWLSLLVYCGPMSAILPTLTTFFGVMNGVLARAQGKAGEPWTPGVPWKSTAWRTGIATAGVVLPIAVLTFWGSDRLWPGITVSRGMAITVVALYGGILGYLLHVRAVVKAGRLGAGERTDAACGA